MTTGRSRVRRRTLEKEGRMEGRELIKERKEN